MAKINSVKELMELRDKHRSYIKVRVQGDNIEKCTVITVAMGECGAAKGAREIFNALYDKVDALNLDDVVVMQADCFGFCDAEPTVEVACPGEDPVIYGNVTLEKVDGIIDKHINHNSESAPEILLGARRKKN